MLAPEQIKPFLLHPEKVIRDYAVSYFDDAELRDPELIPLLLQTYDSAMGKEDFYPGDYSFMLAIGARFSCPDALIPELIERMKNDPFHSFQFQEMLLSCNLEAILAYDPDIALMLDPALRTELAQRIKLSQTSTEELWQTIFPAVKPSGQFDYSASDLIARELAKRSELSSERVLDSMSKVADGSIARNDFNDIALVALLGHMRLEEAVPFLIEQLFPDDDLLNDRATRSLIRIGSENVVNRCREAYLRAGEFQKITLSDMFGCIKLPAAETALIELLKQETDIGLASFLADGLCNLASKRGIPLVQKRLEQGYDNTVMMLESSLYCNCTVNGLSFPEMAEWKRMIALEDQRMFQNQLAAEDDDFDEADYGRYSFGDDDFDDGLAEQEQPYIAPPKIGRNDPCPCGSGKKYKKCCASKQDAS